ncbi:MAG: GNAT family N-acetyltransferase [Acidobacteria bacterium]|nr:GNAT family N-acetyltransferase [Acidobacteriota bacterium]
MHPDTILESERLFYRQIKPDDLPWLIEMRTPEPVARYIGGSKWQNPEALATRMQFYVECYEKFGFGVSIMGLKDTGELIGTSGLQPLEDTGEIELAYNMSERFWGQNYGTECARAWLRFGFEQRGLDRIVAIAHPDNVGSWRIMEKCGMTYEKTEEHYGINTVFYAMSKADFERARSV